jgi:amino acid adenylation domain-containing protein
MLVHEAVLEAARRNPDAAALVDAEGKPTSYGELARGVTRLAARLRAEAGDGGRVAIVAPKSPVAVMGMLASLTAGLAYVPVDPRALPARRDFVVRDSECRGALVDPELTGAGEVPVPVFDLQAVPSRRHAALPKPGLDDEAYTLYTSGSTGVPKGVVITHRNASAFVRWAACAYPLRPGDHVAVHAPLHFDLPVYDIYVGLAAGATLHLVPERVAFFPQALNRFLTERRISHVYAVPSALTALVGRSTLRSDGAPALRRILYAGEEFRPEPLAALMAAVPHATVANLYGPIETNVITSYTLDGPPRDRVPIGRPVDGAHVVLLRDDGSVSETGAAEGEIVVAGDCVSPCYLNRPDITERSRIELEAASGRRVFYRTGDIARRDEAGLLHLLGRRDGLVKTRGYRVELGEVEAIIGTHPDVAEVAVVAEPDPDLTNRLHAVVVPTPDRNGDPMLTDRLVRHCRERLPSYMVPSRVHVLATLPKTTTGKIARAELGDFVRSGSKGRA